MTAAEVEAHVVTLASRMGRNRKHALRDAPGRRTSERPMDNEGSRRDRDFRVVLSPRGHAVEPRTPLPTRTPALKLEIPYSLVNLAG